MLSVHSVRCLPMMPCPPRPHPPLVCGLKQGTAEPEQKGNKEEGMLGGGANDQRDGRRQVWAV